MRLMKLEVNRIILAYNLEALDEKVSLEKVPLSFLKCVIIDILFLI